MQTRSQTKKTESNFQESLMWRWAQDSDIHEGNSSMLTLTRTKAFIECKCCMKQYDKYTDYCKDCNIKLSNRPNGFKYI